MDVKGKGVFWKRIDSLRKSMDLTQKELAYKIGVSANTLISWGARDIIPSGNQCYKLADALGVTVEYLITGEEIALPDDEYVSEHGPPHPYGSDNSITILASPRLSRIVSCLPGATDKQLMLVETVLGIEETQKELKIKNA